MNINDIAKIVHEANKAYCEVYGDLSQVDWDEAPDNIKQSAIDGVLFHINNDASPRESHENWLKFKKADGWVYGEVKDDVRKTHPCIVSYDELDEYQKVKDALFVAIVNVLKEQLNA